MHDDSNDKTKAVLVLDSSPLRCTGLLGTLGTAGYVPRVFVSEAEAYNWVKMMPESSHCLVVNSPLGAANILHALKAISWGRFPVPVVVIQSGGDNRLQAHLDENLRSDFDLVVCSQEQLLETLEGLSTGPPQLPRESGEKQEKSA